MKYPLQTGLTLVELIAVLAISAIILAFAIPGTSNLINHSGRHSVLADLIATLNLARNTAINEQTTVTVCAIGEDSKCSGTWSLPITVFRDPERTREITDVSQIVGIIQPLETGRLMVSSGIHDYFRFESSGWSRGTLGNFVWCPDSDDNHYAAQVRINMGGRPRTARDHDGDGIVEDSSGNPINCSSL